MKKFTQIITAVLLASLFSFSLVIAATTQEERIRKLETQQEVNKAILEKDKELKELIEKEIQRSIEVQKQVQETASKTISWFGSIATLISIVIGIFVSLLVWLGFKSYKDFIKELKREFEDKLKVIHSDAEQHEQRAKEAADKIYETLEEIRKRKTTAISIEPEKITDKEKKILDEDALTLNMAQKFGAKLTAKDFMKIATKHFYEQQYEIAIENFKKAIELKPDDAAAYYNWGIVLGKLGRHEEAIEKNKKAIELKPDDAGAYYNWGVALGELGRYEEAIEKYKKAIELKPDYAKAYSNWGATLGKLNRHEETVEKCKKAIELKPDDAGAYYNWGVALGELGRHEEAIEKYKKAIELKPDYEMAYYNLARGYAQIPSINLCCENLKRAIDIDSKYKKMAVDDSDFDKVRDEPCFKQMTQAA